MKIICKVCKKETEDFIKNCQYTKKDGTVVVVYHCNDCNSERVRKYRSTERGARKTREAVYKSIKKHKQKQNSRLILANALRNNKILKPDKCSSCLEKKKVEGHHEDYSKPLDVIWLCRKCHSKLHKHE
jgi:hypothetical protein